MKRIKIHIGEIFVSREPAVVQTLLGSCVSVCLYDRINRIGGMNHILLPGRSDLSHFDGGARYGVNAMELLINELMKMGSLRKNLGAKVFGGANVLHSLDHGITPGTRNIAFAREFLQMEDIPLLGGDLGGVNPRRIYFHTHTGEVFLKVLPALFLGGKVGREEERYEERLSEEMKRPGKIDLFE